ncbi:mechanosensitive ion channel family protein [Haloferula sargassicola]|uniref:Cyclic nucleotide-binding domain-containing protein n=1 Tax=Haloferula sargassicola TaxID=490096 RepID=A0ABP9UQ92_9BACT
MPALDKRRWILLDAIILGSFQTQVAMAVGAGVLLVLALWFLARLALKPAGKRPGLVFDFAAAAIATWGAGAWSFPGETWVNHAGAVAWVAGAMLAWSMVDRLVFSARFQRRRAVHMPMILRQLIGFGVLLAAVSAVLTFGYKKEITGLIATSGVAAVIVGFAMQDLIANVIGGFSIHMTHAYKVGDWLLLDDGRRAEVREINWRSTRLLDNDQVSFELPNSEIVKGRIVNLNRPGEEHAVRMRFGLDYDVPPNVAKEAILAATAEVQGVLGKPEPNVFLIDYGDSAIIYELRVWMRQARLYNLTCDQIRTQLWYELKRRDLRIPFPIRTLEKRTPNVPDHLGKAEGGAVATVLSSGVLACLSEDQAKNLVRQGGIRIHGSGEAIVRRDEEGSSMFVILDGKVAVTGRDASGARITLAHLGVGECFGEMSLLTGEKRSATVRAEGDVLLLEIRKADLAPLFEEVPELVERMGGLLEKRHLATAEASKGGAAWSGGAATGDQRVSLARRIRSFFSA